MVSGFESILRGSGGDGMMDTPVPIPNTEVKHHNGDDSARAQQQQAASSFDTPLGIFFLCVMTAYAVFFY